MKTCVQQRTNPDAENPVSGCGSIVTATCPCTHWSPPGLSRRIPLTTFPVRTRRQASLITKRAWKKDKEVTRVAPRGDRFCLEACSSDFFCYTHFGFSRCARNSARTTTDGQSKTSISSSSELVRPCFYSLNKGPDRLEVTAGLSEHPHSTRDPVHLESLICP